MCFLVIWKLLKKTNFRSTFNLYDKFSDYFHFKEKFILLTLNTKSSRKSITLQYKNRERVFFSEKKPNKQMICIILNLINKIGYMYIYYMYTGNSHFMIRPPSSFQLVKVVEGSTVWRPHLTNVSHSTRKLTFNPTVSFPLFPTMIWS